MFKVFHAADIHLDSPLIGRVGYGEIRFNEKNRPNLSIALPREEATL
jgi:hypothetical protein